MRHVAFLRAVNVGGRTIKMADLKRSFQALALADVETFIASGNVIFQSKRGAASLEAAIEKQLQSDFGFPVATMLRTVEDLFGVLAYVEETGLSGDGSLYVGFLKGRPASDGAAAVAALSTDMDHLHVHGRELYWRSLPGLGQSSLTGARLEKLLGVAATLRNVNTVQRIVTKYQ